MPSATISQRLVRARPTPGPFIDAALAGTMLAGSLALLAHGGLGAPAGQLDWLSGLVAACASLPIVAWRRAPFEVFVATGLASTLLAGLGYSIGLPLGPTAALYLLAASRDERIPWTRRAGLCVIGLFVSFLAATAFAQRGFPGQELTHTTLAWAVAWFAGERTRLRRQHIAELHQRALRAEHEAEQDGRLAVAEERARIARDLHDSAGHAINVIAVRAGAARMRHDADPERSRAALETIEEIARKTAAEIDEIVGALRDRRSPDGAVEAPPGLASLDTLVGHHAAARLEVTIGTAGDPRALSPAVDQAAYRILQEALTNASRHGNGTANVDLAFGDTALALTIANPALPNGATRPSGGHGLIGMRERAILVGGSLQEEHVDDTFRVRALLPYESHRS